MPTPAHAARAHAMLTLLPLALGLGTLAATASGQCPDWRTRGSGLRINGPIYDSTVWDPDGAGPRTPLLVVCGRFSRIGGPDGLITDNIAAWDGHQWQPIGDGIGGRNGFDDYAVYSVKVFRGDLIAGGHFETAAGAPANAIARWNGTAWVPLGSGMSGGEYTAVRAMTVLDGDLIAAGLFTVAGGQPANSIARWDGANWSPLGAGIQGDISGYPPSVFALQDFGEALFVGGAFTHAGGQPARCIARWNGSSWDSLGSGIDFAGAFPYVSALAVSGGHIVAAGAFNVAGGQIALNIARWNGNSWTAMGSLAGGLDSFVDDFTVHNGELYATGGFTLQGADANVARWNGTSWQPLAAGVGRPGYTLASFNGELFVGGWFTRAGDHVVESLARWNGTAWLDIPGAMQAGSTFGVRTITPWAGSVVLAGHYRTTEALHGASTEHLHAWDGRALRPLGTPNHIVHASAVEPGPDGTTNLIIGGQFEYIDGIPFGHIARLSDAPGATWEPMGAGLNDYVSAITRFNGQTYACGFFTASGATPLSYVARFDGAAWQPLAAGPSAGPNLWTYCMKGYQSGPTTQTLVLGGHFTSAGGVLANHIAAFNIDTATQNTFWSRFGSGFNAAVRAIELFNGSLYAAGDFTASGATPLGSIARWNGSAWEQVGDGLNGQVRAMAVVDGSLIVGGYFTSAGGVPVDHLARWDGHQWTRFGGGADGPVFALRSVGNELHVGGEFTRLRQGVVESPIWARFSLDGVPWFVQHPEPQVLTCRQDALFQIAPAPGYGGLSYEWRRNGVPLRNGPTGTGSRIATNGTTLHVLNANESDDGSYVCVITNACGSVISNAASLLMVGACPPCPPDFNSDGVLNSQDLFDFLAAFFAADPFADFNRDDAINSQDFFDFAVAFFAGCD